ncbi:MAG: hypothetical protein IKG14_01630 [Clostridia bacterium]|nr:hypothetical protein [Clostridia bacterium]
MRENNNLIKKYFRILSPDYPEWLDEYIETERMQKQQYISVTCGKIYSKLFDYDDYSSLDHSIAVALIIWNFTHDKKQTLSGLFHDIATPAFKHCVDFLNGDYMNQESTEELTKTLIEESKDIMKLLKRDNIKIEEVCDYHIYPIADNDTPMLSADRLEYSLSNDLIVFKTNTLEEINEIYNDIKVQTNEEGIIELGFKTKKIARKFVKNTSRLSVCYRDNATRFYMQAIADILKKVSKDGLINKEDLYELKESEVIDIVKKSKYNDVFKKLTNATKVNISKEEPKGMYYVKHGAKVRYIDPLYNGNRISKECKITKKMIDNNLSYNMDDYVFIDNSLNVLI